MMIEVVAQVAPKANRGLHSATPNAKRQSADLFLEGNSSWGGWKEWEILGRLEFRQACLALRFQCLLDSWGDIA